ncbi:MAG: hypothetical protein M0R02_07135 [Bacteroidales bacterium]|nr:hypothetical protein [Bacteroidales bacterium]NLK80942.1 hypothetical protein [Bacteroidales bacterium]HPY81905.1 hypothetical protein [Bacteroidales bacterium]
MTQRILILFLIFSSLFSCTTQTKKVTINHIAQVANEYSLKIKEFESKIDPTNIQLFLQLNDSIRDQRKNADSILSQFFISITDTLFIPFTQTENLDKIHIENVWVVGATFNQLFIEARVKALDNSGLHGPYTSLSAFDSDDSRLSVGGGIGGNPEYRLEAGEIYVFSGKIDNLNLLTDFKRLQFDEVIKKW